MAIAVPIRRYGQPITIQQQEQRLEIGAYRQQEYLPHIIITKELLTRDSAVQMGLNSQTAPRLGRRPSTTSTTTARGSQALQVATV